MNKEIDKAVLAVVEAAEILAHGAGVIRGNGPEDADIYTHELEHIRYLLECLANLAAKSAEKTNVTTYHQGAAGLPLPKRGSIWRHYKGNLYRVVLLAMAPDATTWVVYAPVMSEGINQHFCQPLSRWHESVNGTTRMAREKA